MDLFWQQPPIPYLAATIQADVQGTVYSLLNIHKIPQLVHNITHSALKLNIDYHME